MQPELKQQEQQEEKEEPEEKKEKEITTPKTNKIMVKWKAVIIEIGINSLMDVIQKSKRIKKFGDFLFSEKMQNTLSEVYKAYTLALEEWEDDEAG